MRQVRISSRRAYLLTEAAEAGQRYIEQAWLHSLKKKHTFPKGTEFTAAFNSILSKGWIEGTPGAAGETTYAITDTGRKAIIEWNIE